MSDSDPKQALPTYVPYGDDVEEIAPDKRETHEKIIAAMNWGGQQTRQKHGRSVRTSHAKAHALLKGELWVLEGLPAHLRQGLFAVARAYPVVVRLSHVPETWTMTARSPDRAAVAQDHRGGGAHAAHPRG